MWGVGFTVILIGAFVAMALASKNTGLPSSTAVAKDTVNFEITSEDHVKGPSDAKATLVEFGDFQCPACASYYPLVEKLHEDFPNDLRVVFKHFPLKQIHQQAQNSAEASEAAALQGKFWEMYAQLYSNQDKWVRTSGRETFEQFATAIGLDMTKFSSDLNSGDLKDRVRKDEQYGISLGLNSTPSFYLNGKKISNPQSYEEFKNAVSAAIVGNDTATSTEIELKLN